MKLSPLREARSRNLRLINHLQKIVLILERPLDKKNLNRDLHKWFEQTKILISEN